MKKFSRREFLPLAGLTLVSVSCLAVERDQKWMGRSVIRPKKLSKGDTIGVCAPAGGIKSPEELSEFQSILETLGYKVKFSQHVGERSGYFSSDDATRAADFMSLVTDPEVNAIYFIRGGWGCARLLKYLDFDSIKQHPKIIMGFSDITTLLNAITAKTGMITFHGPGGNSSWNDYSVQWIKGLLEEEKNLSFKNQPNDQKIHTYQSGKATGELYGGNLSVLSTLIGSNFLPDWTGKILFLEDVMEEPYRIDRMLTHLKLAGVFDAVAGVVLGSFRKCEPEEPQFSFTLDEVFEQHFEDFDKPVFYGAQFGHTTNKFTLPVGTLIEMDADSGTLLMLEPAVSS